MQLIRRHFYGSILTVHQPSHKAILGAKWRLRRHLN
jgi:hypothetical protein